MFTVFAIASQILYTNSQTVLVPWEKFSQLLLEFNKNVRQELSRSATHRRLEEFPALVQKKKELCRVAQAQAVLLLSQFMIAYSLEDAKSTQEIGASKEAAERYYSDEIPLDALRYVSWIDNNDAEHQFARNVLPALFSSMYHAIQETLFEVLEIDVGRSSEDVTVDVEESKTTADVSRRNDELKDNGAFLRSADKQRELPPRRDKALIDNENTEQLILRHKERTMQRKKRDFKKELAKAFKGMK